MAAPIRKVAPNAFIVGAIENLAAQADAANQAASSPSIHDSLSAFGTVVSSSGPQILGQAASYRAQIRRFASGK